jgi:hypothetical protein
MYVRGKPWLVGQNHVLTGRGSANHVSNLWPGRRLPPGNFMYKGSAPIFITTKAEDMAWLESHASINPCTNAPWDADASMLLRRLKVYKYTKKVAKPPARLKYCPRCFVDLVMAQAGEELI